MALTSSIICDHFAISALSRLAPLALDPPLMFNPVEDNIKRLLSNLQPITRDLLDAQHAVAMKRAYRDSENRHLEGHPAPQKNALGNPLKHGNR